MQEDKRQVTSSICLPNPPFFQKHKGATDVPPAWNMGQLNSTNIINISQRYPSIIRIFNPEHLDVKSHITFAIFHTDGVITTLQPSDFPDGAGLRATIIGSRGGQTSVAVLEGVDSDV